MAFTVYIILGSSGNLRMTKERNRFAEADFTQTPLSPCNYVIPPPIVAMVLISEICISDQC